jgi:hypothetical protein
MPILGVIDSAKTGNLATNSFDSIATVTLTSSQSSISFTSIPQTYRHLQVRALMRNDISGGNTSTIFVGMNSDTGANYSSHRAYGGGGGTTGVNTTGTSLVTPSNTHGIGAGAGSTATTGVVGANIIDFLDYTNTNKYKTVRSYGGIANNASEQYVLVWSQAWTNTNAITTLTFTSNATNFVSGCVFALYGIEG